MRSGVGAFFLIVSVLTCMPADRNSSYAGVETLSESLRKMDDFRSGVKVEVSLPMAANDEIEYNVNALSSPASGDSLSTINYLIEWSLPTPNGVSKGFSSYFNGDFYRYREGSALQEYHADDNVQPFISQSPVHKTTQFIDVFPVNLGAEIHAMAKDTTYSLVWTPDTVFHGENVAVLKSERRMNNQTVAEITYVFDKVSLSPKYIEKEMSPGTISEQTIIYEYLPEDNPKLKVPTNEEELISIYPEIFSNFREGNYGLESLKDRQLPGFSLPNLNGDRYSRLRTDGFSNPTLIAFVEEDISSTPGLIKDIRKGINSLPFSADIIWVFLSNRHDEIEEAVGKTMPGEIVLMSGRNAVKDFGVTETPSFLFVNVDGKVSDILSGLKPDMESTVMQKMAITK